MNGISNKLFLALSLCLLNNVLHGAAAQLAEIKEQKEEKAGSNIKSFIEWLGQDDVNIIDEEGNRPLQAAIQRYAEHPSKEEEELEIMKFLLDRNANPNIPNHSGNTALISAVMEHDPYEHPAAFELLLQYESNPHFKRQFRQNRNGYYRFTNQIL